MGRKGTKRAQCTRWLWYRSRRSAKSTSFKLFARVAGPRLVRQGVLVGTKVRYWGWRAAALILINRRSRFAIGSWNREARRRRRRRRRKRRRSHWWRPGERDDRWRLSRARAMDRGCACPTLFLGSSAHLRLRLRDYSPWLPFVFLLSHARFSRITAARFVPAI